MDVLRDGLASRLPVARPGLDHDDGVVGAGGMGICRYHRAWIICGRSVSILTCVGLKTMRERGTTVRRSQSSSGAALTSDEPVDDSSTHAGWSALVRCSRVTLGVQRHDATDGQGWAGCNCHHDRF